MSDYSAPNINNIPFNFQIDGYSAPDFDNIDFNHTIRPSTSEVANLQAAIEVMGLYHNTTYTYTKECRTVVVGYSTNGIQTLKLPCLYGGIRDLGATLQTLPPNKNLLVYIFAEDAVRNLKAWFRFAVNETNDLIARVRTIQIGTSDLITAVLPTRHGVLDLITFQRATYKSSNSLLSYLRIMQGTEQQFNLEASIYDIQPVNIQGILNVIEIRNMEAYIKGDWWKGSYNIKAEFYRFYQRQYQDLGSNLTGWALKDLQASIVSFWKMDLNAAINGGFFAIHKDLLSFIRTVVPVFLQATLHGYATKNLYAQLVQGWGPYDLQAYTDITQPVNLPANIRGHLKVEKSQDIKAYISSFTEANIVAFINTIEYKRLVAYINSVGKYKDLEVKIVPKTINIKRILLVPLFEHKNLLATISYNCRLSGFKNLSANMYLIFKKDLRANIIGWHQGTADNIKELKAYINVNDINVVNSINVSGSIHQTSYVTHDVRARELKSFKQFNCYSIRGNGYIRDLAAYITGHLTHRDLYASITSTPLPNFRTVPNWIRPKTREVVINLERFESNWKRFIDFMFFTNSDKDFHYFYVSGTNGIYKIDKQRTWVIWVKGYSYNNESMYTNYNVRRKFIFNLNNYNTVDAAVRDMIARVSELREVNLKANINGTLGNYFNLKAYVGINIKYSWMTHLIAHVKAVTKQYIDLNSNIQSELYKGSTNLTVDIAVKSYEPYLSNNILFKFEDPGYKPPSPYTNMNWTNKQAEDFWKED